MSLSIGSELGSYRVVGLLGVGGMGEVYRASDARLGRDVAVKVLPSEVIDDPDRLKRFESEARALAALNHPNIAAIYDVEEHAGGRALVMELVDGETLDERLARAAGKPLPIADALAIARQIAAALAAAHEKNIVHRDLKPANVKLTRSGNIKVLDFGLAKFHEAPSAAHTEIAGTTRYGAVLGTAGYMSPEQARGLSADRRSDVWAFGCVLFELLTGRRAFGGATPSDALAASLEREPDWTRLPPNVPATVRRVLQRCLEKDASRRLRDLGDVGILLDDALTTGAAEPPTPAGPARRTHVVWAVAAALGIAAAAAGMFAVQSATRQPFAPPAPPLRTSISAPGGIAPQLSGAISPDGRHLAFVATGPSGRSMLWVRPLDSLEARELPGTERAAHPFWSPDSRSLGFIADSKVKRVDLAGGNVQTLADTGPGRSGGSWSRDGVIVFSAQFDQLGAVPAAGGPVKVVATADAAAGQLGVAWPDFLPDGRHFLYFTGGISPETRGVYVGSLDSAETKLLLNTDIKAKYAAPGYLLFPRDDTLLAQPFDARTLELGGAPVPIADGVWSAPGAAHASFSASQTGMLAYVNASQWDRQLFWFERSGRPLGSLGAADRDQADRPELSPDGREIALVRGAGGRRGLWIVDAASGAATRLTFSPALASRLEQQGLVSISNPIWAGDGSGLLLDTGSRAVLKNLVDGSEQPLFEGDGAPVDWSRDGRFLVLARLGASTGIDLWAVDLGGGEPFPVADSRFNEVQPQLSPDGRWLAYTANETGRDEVYVQSFPQPGRKRQISTDGGAMPRWRGDGSELFYLAADQYLTAVPVSGGDAPSFGAPARLFRMPLLVQGSESIGLPTAYDAAPDGHRFLVLGSPEDREPPMTVVANWPSLLER